MPPIRGYAPYVAREYNFDVDTYVEATETVGFSLIQDATKSVEKLRHMFEEQRACPFEPFAGPDTTVEELIFSFTFWIDALREVFRSFKEQNLKPRIARAIGRSGLLELYQDIMVWPGFFSQDQVRHSYRLLISRY